MKWSDLDKKMIDGVEIALNTAYWKELTATQAGGITSVRKFISDLKKRIADADKFEQVSAPVALPKEAKTKKTRKKKPKAEVKP